MMKLRSLPLFVCFLALPLSSGCDTEDDTSEGDPAAEEDTGGETGETGEAGGEEGPAEDPDSDEDGLSDAEEAELGTDPNLKDTDSDNYWDSWEVTEGTDPLDPASRIYQGSWPYNPNKDELEAGTVSTATTEKGSLFPRQAFVDNHGDYVDIYDFSEFTNADGDLAFMIVDMSAMWCGPCHNMADWIAGVDNNDTAGLQQSYPTVREKVHDLRIWWLTFVVEAADGSPPTLGDAQSWYASHQDPYIPILADENVDILPIYNGGQFPFFFLLDPYMAIEDWRIPGPSDNPFYALFLVDQYL